jgi:hypothetical protein
MILTWGLPDDGPVVAVREQFDRLGRAEEFFLLDQSRYADVRGNLQIQEGCLAGWLENAKQRMSFDDLTGIYMRPYPFRSRQTVASCRLISSLPSTNWS